MTIITIIIIIIIIIIFIVIIITIIFIPLITTFLFIWIYILTIRRLLLFYILFNRVTKSGIVILNYVCNQLLVIIDEISVSYQSIYAISSSYFYIWVIEIYWALYFLFAGRFLFIYALLYYRRNQNQFFSANLSQLWT